MLPFKKIQPGRDDSNLELASCLTGIWMICMAVHFSDSTAVFEDLWYGRQVYFFNQATGDSLWMHPQKSIFEDV